MTIFRRHSRSLSDSGPILEALTSSSRYLLADFDDKDNVVVSQELVNYSCRSDINSNSNDNSNDNSNGNNSSEDRNIHNITHDINKQVNRICSEENGHEKEDEASGSTQQKQEEEATLQEEEEALAHALLEDYQVKLGPKDDKVCVTVEVPDGIDKDDLKVHVDKDCILRVTGEVTRTVSDNTSSQTSCSSNASNATSDSNNSHQQTMARVEQTFQLDEQALEIDQLQAKLSKDGVLKITAPKKEQDKCTLRDELEIIPARPRRVASSHLQVIVDLPGVHLEDIHVSYANGKLRVSASRHFGQVRSFKRTIPIHPEEFDVDKMKAYLSRGKLYVQTPPKDCTCMTRDIDIQTESEAEETRHKNSSTMASTGGVHVDE